MFRPSPTAQPKFTDNTLVEAMGRMGYTLADIQPAFDPSEADDVADILADNVHLTNRPVEKYGLLSVEKVRSSHVNIDMFSHRGTPRGDPRQENGPINLFLMGGSTCLGYNLSDKHIISEQVQNLFDKAEYDVNVFNFGSGNYTIRHEFLRLIDLLEQGFKPHAIAFLDGYNDGFYSVEDNRLVGLLDHLYRSDKQLRKSTGLERLRLLVEKIFPSSAQDLPGAGSFDPASSAPEYQPLLTTSAIQEALANSNSPTWHLDTIGREIGKKSWDRYLRFATLVQTLVEPMGIPTLFFWQPTPFRHCSPEQRLMERLYEVFKPGVLASHLYRYAESVDFAGAKDRLNFVDLSACLADYPGPVYLDVCHYTPGANAKLAADMFPFLKSLVETRHQGPRS